MQKYIYKITDFYNYDGDSFDLTLDLGFDLTTHKKTRIDGIDTPELRGGTVQSKALAKHAKMMAAQWVYHAMAQGGAYFSSEGYKGKFGRPLGDIVNAKSGSLRNYLIEQKLAVSYHGQAKSEVAGAHADILKHHLDLGTIQ